MGILFGLIKLSFKLFFYTFCVLVVLIYAPFLLDINPQHYSILLPKEFDGPLAPNNHLSEAEHLFNGELIGPESLAPWKGDLYSGLHDGRIVRIRDGKITTVAQMTTDGQCVSLSDLKRCGRPLGLTFDSKGMLYVVDAYHGLKKVDIPGRQGSVSTIFSPDVVIDGNSSKFLDDVAVDEGAGKNGGNVYYISDVGSKWPVEYVMYIILEHEPTGRIIKYDEDTKTASILTKGHYFPNGIVLTDAKDAILFCEFSKRRIMKHYIRGPKMGTTEVLIQHLPAEPDNLRRASDPKKETYWIGLTFARTQANPHLLDIMSDKPLIRKAVMRLVHSVGQGLEFLGSLTNLITLKEFGFYVKSGFALMHFDMKNYGLIMEIDAKGNILRSLHSPDGKTTVLSEVREVVENNKKILYLGSFSNTYLGKLVLK